MSRVVVLSVHPKLQNFFGTKMSEAKDRCRAASRPTPLAGVFSRRGRASQWGFGGEAPKKILTFYALNLEIRYHFEVYFNTTKIHILPQIERVTEHIFLCLF